MTGRLASLNRFVSKLVERSLPFFEVLKGTDPFQWGPKQQEAFEELKNYLIHLTTLSPPAKYAHLLLYVAAAPVAVSIVLVQERQDDEKKTQSPVYFSPKLCPLQRQIIQRLRKSFMQLSWHQENFVIIFKHMISWYLRLIH